MGAPTVRGVIEFLRTWISASVSTTLFVCILGVVVLVGPWQHAVAVAVAVVYDADICATFGFALCLYQKSVVDAEDSAERPLPAYDIFV